MINKKSGKTISIAITQAKTIIKKYRQQNLIIDLESWDLVIAEHSLIGYENNFSRDVVLNIVQELGSRLRGMWQIDYQR